MITSLVAIIPAMVGVLAVPTTADALPLTALTCNLGTASATYSPGITATPAEVTTNATYSYEGCVDVGGSGITSGKAGFAGSETRSCLDLLATSTGRQTVTWNDGSKSTAQLTAVRTQEEIGLVLNRTGSVVEGRFKGAVYTETIVYVGVDALAECSQPEGLNRLDGIVTAVAIVGL